MQSVKAPKTLAENDDGSPRHESVLFLFDRIAGCFSKGARAPATLSNAEAKARAPCLPIPWPWTSRSAAYRQQEATCEAKRAIATAPAASGVRPTPQPTGGICGAAALATQTLPRGPAAPPKTPPPASPSPAKLRAKKTKGGGPQQQAQQAACAARGAGDAMPPSGAFSVANILGKLPGEPRLEDEYAVDKQIGKGAFGVVRLVRAPVASGSGQRVRQLRRWCDRAGPRSRACAIGA
jgi:hypothetical protein